MVTKEIPCSQETHPEEFRSKGAFNFLSKGAGKKIQTQRDKKENIKSIKQIYRLTKGLCTIFHLFCMLEVTFNFEQKAAVT